MENKFQLPNLLKVERNVISDIKSILEEENIKYSKYVFVVDENLINVYKDKIDFIINQLGEDNYIFCVTDNSIKEVSKLNEKVFNFKADLIIGFGGGRVLDICKYVSFMSRVKFISMPTALAHDGIASPIAVLKDKTGITNSCGCEPATAILIDLDIIKSSPLILKQSGVGDLISNIVALKDWKLAEKYNGERINDFAVMLSKSSIASIITREEMSLDDYKFLETLSYALIMSGVAMEMAGTSRPCSGSEHMISHSIDYILGGRAPHGIQVALGTIISLMLYKEDYSNIIDIYKRLEISLPKLTREEFLRVMDYAPETRKGRYTIFDIIDDKKVYEDIYEELSHMGIF